ncbi:uncharacterized protein NPIL_365591 [Nephila pilipes]|uniref:Uncharacterized protein n=1 Tax=Nephila pilipes TaxID=299642 RepID=A0A8X6UAH4_NEPPI|nr:uncharacterized protein NPIL_365541 [Nephila pilipes]GFT97424.1 uncharacterized protein NPIL_365591 [Nephila pilipes]
MEKYGYVTCDVQEYLYIHPALFNSFIDIVQHVVLRQSLDNSKKIVYFKVLNNSEIVQYIHGDNTLEQFGFCLLHKADLDERFKLHSTCKNLYDSIFDCLLTARETEFDETSGCSRFQFEYSKLLNDDEVIHLLHIL